MAYHEVATGTKARVYVDQNGERVEYNVTNLDKLRGYISTLQASIAQGGTNGMFAKPSGPARFLF